MVMVNGNGQWLWSMVMVLYGNGYETFSKVNRKRNRKRKSKKIKIYWKFPSVFLLYLMKGMLDWNKWYVKMFVSKSYTRLWMKVSWFCFSLVDQRVYLEKNTHFTSRTIFLSPHSRAPPGSPHSRAPPG